MYLLVVGFTNGGVEYYGPFPSEDRARVYAVSVERDLKPSRWHIVSLTVPYHTVVKRVEWVNGLSGSNELRR